MIKIKAWVSAARLRTLPLSISGIVVGSSIGHHRFYTTDIFWLAILTTLGLQILSNFANDYGDGVKGTDNEKRVGPQRAIQSGVITKKEMYIGIIITVIITFLLAITLIYRSFGLGYFMYSLFFFVLGVLAIVAAMKYTIGNTAYGYKGLGDVFVFLFFGLVSVIGSYFLFTKQWNGLILLLAIAVGLLSTAVLNLNNMRDYKNDKSVGKNTLVVKLGIRKTRQYHYFLIIGAMLSIVFFLISTYRSPKHLLFLIAFVPLTLHLVTVIKNKNAELLDPELKKVALTTFLMAVLFSLGYTL